MVELPFPVAAYGKLNTHILISDNGVVYMNGHIPFGNFDKPDDDYAEDLSTQTKSVADDVMIAGVWNNLDISASGNVSYGTEGTMPNRMFVIHFFNISYDGDSSGGNTFQIKLFENASTTTPSIEPSDFKNISKFLEIKRTSLGAYIFLNVSYDDADVMPVGLINETALIISKNNGSWHTNPASFSSSSGVNITANYVFANITNFGSIFAPLGDVDPPIISLISPANSTVLISSVVNMTYNVTDDGGIASCSIYLDGSLNETNGAVVVDTTLNFTKTLADGNYSWSVSCVDSAGNVGNSETRYFTVAVPVPSALGGGAPGASFTRTCNSTTEHVSISTIATNWRLLLTDDYCQDLRISEILFTNTVFSGDIFITRQELPFEIPSFGGTRDIRYRSYELTTSLQSSDIGEVVYNFRVPKNWDRENAVITKQVTLAKYDGRWMAIESRLIGEDDSYYYFESRTNELSYYLISGPQVDIWYVLGTIDSYYQGQLQFLGVLDAISKYYTIY
jgi:PGF-pre-PGF domain-containing protein